VHIHRDVMIRWRVLKTWRTCAFAFGFSEQLLCLSSTQIDLRPPFRPQLTLKLKGPYRSKRESTLDASVLPLRSQTKVPRQCDGGAMLVSAFAPQRPRLRESTSTTNAPSLATSQFVGVSSRELWSPQKWTALSLSAVTTSTTSKSTIDSKKGIPTLLHTYRRASVFMKEITSPLASAALSPKLSDLTFLMSSPKLRGSKASSSPRCKSLSTSITLQDQEVEVGQILATMIDCHVLQ